jgi:hypothetical protein
MSDALAVNIDLALTPPPALGNAGERVKTTGQMPPETNIGAFRIICKPSHMAADDPIVYPDQPGRSHLHTFFGNTGAVASAPPTAWPAPATPPATAAPSTARRTGCRR